MLNPEQEAVVNHTWGPALVIAGPGSGKTRTVVYRTARLLREGISPEEIVLVTFTRKAAHEMRERLAHLVGEETANRVWISTFHSLAASILRDRGNIRILDAEAAKKVLAGFLEEMEAPRRITPKVVQGAISRAKNAGWDKSYLLSHYADLEPYLGRAYDRYEEYKAERGYLDFDDLLIEAVKVLEEEEDLRATWSRRARFLTVDEYQDTNLQQFRLVSLLLGPEENIVAVGDPNQAIYSWRGADYRLILEFRRHFPRARVYHLSINYRSHGGVVDAALHLIRNNREREDLPLKAIRFGELPIKVTAETKEEEALFVAEAAKLALDGGVPSSQIAILMRSLSASRVVEAALRRFRVPYTIVGSVGFWGRKEVKLVLNLLHASYGDTLALTEAIAMTIPGFGPKKAAKAAQDLGHGRSPYLESLRGLAEGQKFLEVLEDIRNLHGLTGYALANAFWTWLSTHRDFFRPILLDLSEGVLEGAEDRWANLEEMSNALRGFAETTPKGDLALFLQDVLLSEEEPQEKGEGVRIMTLHASKGLEFHTVIITGLVEGFFPSWQSAKDPKNLEEERRLLYVGLTRAKETLYLTTYRVGERGPTMPSRFLDEIPGHHLTYNPTIGFHGKDETQAANALSQIASLEW
ncbi:ATP-dependent helicase [Thermus albus]|uniref:ATP-dependent helicase n=1 Tax=Thermus albus TaxID=2908146 RepID=UPI001FAA1856|nr:UvrD-helicase domain-containing protein [Thermus albus]